MNRVVSRLGLTAIAIVAGSVAGYAQSSTTGAVSGVVTDDKGAPLAGATVTLTSAQLTRTVTTGSDGSFRLGLLNPGSWSVRVAKDGYQTITNKVDVSTNETRAVNVKLPATGSTTVVITTTVPVVDLTSTTQGQNVSMESVAAVPKGRDFTSMAFFAPGVVSSGFGDPSINGASGAENSYVVDGLVTTDFRYGFQGASLKTDFIDQVEVQTGGFRPEFSALGGVFNAVTKSGSNDFKGSAWLTWDAIGIHAAQKKNAYYREGAPDSRYDVGAEIGGAFIKDKLFYYFGVDGDISESNGGTANLIGLRDSDGKTNNIQTVGKLNWYITQDMQLTWFVNYNNVKADQEHTYTFIGNADFGGTQKDTTLNTTVNFDWTISPSLLLSVKAGYTDSDNKFDPTNTSAFMADNLWFIDGPGRNDGSGTYPGVGPDPSAALNVNGALAGLNYNRGGNGYTIFDSKGKTTQFKADLSWFLGTHSLKFGVSWLESKYTELAGDTGNFHRYATALSPAGVDRLYQYTQSTNATVKADFTAFYAQDSWEMFPGFRLMYGFRYEIQDQKDLNNKSFLKYDKFKDVTQPRVGFTWDINNDGQSKLSGSYATYYEQIPQRLAIRVFANETYLRARYTANGVNAFYDHDTGAYGVINPQNFTQLIDYATPFSFDPIALNTKLPQRTEWALGFDQQLSNGWTAGIHGKYRRLKNPIEDMVITNHFGDPYDEGPAIAFGAGGAPLYGVGAAILGNPGQFQEWAPNPKSMTLYYLNNNITTNAWGIWIPGYYDRNRGVFSVHGTGYDDNAGNNYYSVDFTLDKRTDRDYVAFSYTWSRLQGNYEGVVSSSNGQSDGNITASFDYYPYVGYGLLPLDRTNQVKLQFSHRFTVAGNDLNLGGSWQYLSGSPISLFDDGSTTNGYKPGWDTAYEVFTSPNSLGGDPVVANSDAAYNDPNNYDANGYWIGGASVSHPFLDLGGYGNATPANGQLGQYGRTPATNKVDIHADYVMKFGRVSVAPMVDIFNLFNSRVATSVSQQATDGVGNYRPQYGVENGWLEGRHYRFGVKFRF